MDTTDRQILQALQANGRATASQIARQVSLSVPAVSERMRKLEDSGVILGYAARVDQAALGRGLMAFILVLLSDSKWVDGFREAVTGLDAVTECHHIAGEYDYLLKTRTSDTKELEGLLKDLKRIRGVARTNTVIALATVKDAP